MATLALTAVFINNAASGAYVTAQSGPDRPWKVGKDVDVRTYGGGRRRAVTRAGRLESLAVTLRLVTAADLATLDSWIGQHVLYRDDRGRRIVGVYDGVEPREYRDDKTRYDVALTINGVTYAAGGLA